MKTRIVFSAALLAGIFCGAALAGAASKPAKKALGLDAIETVVVIYAENRSFDNLYGYFPGANGLQHVTSRMSLQRDRDGSVMKELPPVWGGLTVIGGDAAGHRSADPASAQPAVRDR